MIVLNCLIDFLSTNQDHLWYALSGIGAAGTLVVASRALNTWQKEKKYDLTIENLATCNVAVGYIEALRYPASSTSEIKKEYKEEIDKQPIDDRNKRSSAEALLIYQSRRDNHQDILENVLRLRERNWAVYGENHDFYLFFNRIVEIDKEIRVANIRHYHAMTDKTEYSDDVFRAIMKETVPVMYSKLDNNDSIVKELADWIDKLKKYRKKQ